MGEHFAQNPVYFMAGISRRQHRLRAGNLFTHTRKMAEIAIAKRMVQQLAALLGADARLLYGSCEQIQGRVIGQLRIRLAKPLENPHLQQHAGWVADRLTLSGDTAAENAGA